jgi:predicted CXXCH cytochrome family protein
MKKWFKRLGLGFSFAVPLMLITYALTYSIGIQPVYAANPVESMQLQTQELPDCATCHPALVQSWEAGYHSQSMSDPLFKESWEAQGKPVDCLNCHVTGYDEETGTWQSDGITCLACHPTITAKHPAEPIEINHSPDMCGNCHSETYFEWQVSTHGQKGLSCANCHDPHATTLKMETSASLCSTCHKGLSTSYTHSQHNAQGLVCVDCHMESIEKDSGGHLRKDHSFFVSLDTCNRCHANQLHDPGLFQPQAAQVNPVDAMAAVEDVQVSGMPQPVKPTAFALLAGLVGIALGINLAPMLEKWSRRRRGENNE